MKVKLDLNSILVRMGVAMMQLLPLMVVVVTRFHQRLLNYMNMRVR